MKVTAKQLRGKDACDKPVDVFQKEWPEGVEITLDVLQRAMELKLDLDWFADSFLPASASEAYEKATTLAWEAYLEAIALAWVAYQKAKASVLYQEITKFGL